jgi:RecA/RadA recombinase
MTIDIDKIINEANKGLKLLPTNLVRGDLVSDAVPTGSLALDLILGGGWAPCRRSNVFGREGSGKSTLLYHAVKACIDQKIHVVFYDFEGSTDGDRVERIGVKHNWLKELKADEPVYFRYYNTMKDGEQMFMHAHQILDALPDVESGPVQVAFFLDSIPTVPTRRQMGTPDTEQPSLRARLFSSQLPVIKSQIAAKRCIWIDTNALREKPGQKFGNPEYEAGGDAVKSQSDCRVKAKKTIAPVGRGKSENKSYIEEEDALDGGLDRYNFISFYTVKNKSFSPFRECVLRIWFEAGGQPLGMLDPVYDVYEYLRLTNQIRYKAHQFHISLSPFDQERSVTIEETTDKGEPKYDAKTGEVLTKTFNKTEWTWLELKQYILNPPKSKKINMRELCRAQIADGSAFKLYFDAITYRQELAATRKAEKKSKKEEAA